MTIEPLERRELLSANVLSYHNDNLSSGVNAAETLLTPTNVNATQFGKQFSTPLDGLTYAQPLYVSGVNITTGASQGFHNVVYAATEHDSVYALDGATGQVLWQRSFIDPAHGVTTVPATDVGTDDIGPEVGITSTGVVDAATSTLYVTAKTKEVIAGKNHYVLRLHALDLGSGAEKLGGPAVIADTTYDGANYGYVSGPYVNGTGEGAVGGKIYFNALRENQRAALTLAGGSIYIACASHADEQPYHGWVLAFNASSLQIRGALNATPNGEGAGIWMSGGKVSVDPQGYLYVVTGDGTFDTTLNAKGLPSNGNYGDSLIKIAVDPTTTQAQQNINGWGLKVVDYFTPSNQAYLNDQGLDLGSTGVLILPDSAGSAAHPHLLVFSGKDGRVFLIDRDNLGKFDPNNNNIVQTEDLLVGLFGTPTYFNGLVTLADGYGGTARQFPLANGTLNPEPINETKEEFNIPALTPSISANGASNAIIWMLSRGSNELRAYRASNLNSVLYRSSQASANRDALGAVVKFTLPTVADGRVYVGTTTSLVGYGLFSQSTVFSDGFNRANSTSLGASWTKNVGSLKIQSKQLAAATTATSIATVTGVSLADVSVSADVNVGASGKVGLIARYTGAGNGDYYMARLAVINGTVYAQILKSVGGVLTQLSRTPVSSGTGRLRFDVVGSSLKVYLNDQLVSAVQDGTISGSGLFGVRLNGGTLDNFSANLP